MDTASASASAESDSDSVTEEGFVDKYALVHGPLVVSICVFGIVSNIVNIIVLTRRQMIGSCTNVLLTGLSVSQLVLLCNYLIYTAYVIADTPCNRSTKSYAWLSYLLLNVNLNLVSHTIALVHTTSLAVFRYVAVAYPVSGKKLVSAKAARRVVLAAFVSVPLVCTTFYPNSVVVVKNTTAAECPQWWTLTNDDAGDQQPESTSDVVVYALRYHADRRVLRDYNFWFFGTVCKLLPCTLLVILSLLLLQELNRVRKRRRKQFGSPRRKSNASQSSSSMSQAERNRWQVTIMLLIIVLLFVAVELPQGILNMLSAILKDDFIDIYTSLGDFFEMLTVGYSSLNFILYCTMSSQFRATFKVLFLGTTSLPYNRAIDGKWTKLGSPPTPTIGQRRQLRGESVPTSPPPPPPPRTAPASSASAAQPLSLYDYTRTSR